MSETRNLDKTINEFIMTADKITQLLYDRNIVFLFNEDIPSEEQNETTKLLKKGLASERDDSCLT